MRWKKPRSKLQPEVTANYGVCVYMCARLGVGRGRVEEAIFRMVHV